MIHKLDQVLALFSLDRTELTGPEIAALIKRPKSTVYRLLASFTGAGYLDQDRDTGRYRVGIRLAALGMSRGTRPRSSVRRSRCFAT